MDTPSVDTDKKDVKPKDTKASKTLKQYSRLANDVWAKLLDMGLTDINNFKIDTKKLGFGGSHGVYIDKSSGPVFSVTSSGNSGSSYLPVQFEKCETSFSVSGIPTLTSMFNFPKVIQGGLSIIDCPIKSFNERKGNFFPRVNGDIILFGLDIVNLEGINISGCTGLIVKDCGRFMSLKGLPAKVNFPITVVGCEMFEFDGSVKAIGSDLTVIACGMTTLSGFPKVVSGDVDLFGNPALASLYGVDDTEVGGNFILSYERASRSKKERTFYFQKPGVKILKDKHAPKRVGGIVGKDNVAKYLYEEYKGMGVFAKRSEEMSSAHVLTGNKNVAALRKHKGNPPVEIGLTKDKIKVKQGA